jgi:hypothetical protein
MSALTSMLVPLETLAVLPLALNYSRTNVLLLLIVIPLVGGIIISVVVNLTTRHHHGADAPWTDPTWIGSKAQHDEVLGTDNAAGQAALQGGPIGRSAGQSSAGQSSSARPGAGAGQSGSGSGPDDVGGASARW